MSIITDYERSLLALAGTAEEVIGNVNLAAIASVADLLKIARVTARPFQWEAMDESLAFLDAVAGEQLTRGEAGLTLSEKRRNEERTILANLRKDNGTIKRIAEESPELLHGFLRANALDSIYDTARRNIGYNASRSGVRLAMWTEPNACSFCHILASQSGGYKKEFHPHSCCKCLFIPMVPTVESDLANRISMEDDLYSTYNSGDIRKTTAKMRGAGFK